MKKHLSVLMLMARCSIRHVLTVLAVMALTELGLFRLALARTPSGGSYSLELLLSRGHAAPVFCAALLLVTVPLTLTGQNIGGKQTYTLTRLSVSGRWVFFWQSVYNAVCYWLLWAVQILVSILLCRLYMVHAPAEYLSGQTVFLAFYRSAFLHSLLPFEDAGLWARNILALLSLGLCSAHDPAHPEKRSLPLLFLLAASAVLFVRPLGEYTACLLLIACSLIASALTLRRVFGKEDEHDA